jgi:para-nitrobenzyl esterase
MFGASNTSAQADPCEALLAAPVQVEGGAILGALGAGGTIARYLGVPFAAPPVAGLRWRPTQPVAPWQGVLETTTFAPACPQPLPPSGSFYQKEFFGASERQSEDCPLPQRLDAGAFP